MNYIPSDSDIIVRLSFAECVAELAQTAHRFLELAQLHTNQEDDSALFHYQVQGSYDSELMQLQESFQGKIVHLLSDTESSVKKSFLKHSAGKLCIFFGPQRAKEVILSHMITFLNDKSDWELHKAFFECIVSVAKLLRHHSLPILEPLLQQGLSSGEEMVVCKTIEAMTTLCAEGLFDRQTLFENITTLAPFLVYPNMWVIYGTVGFLIAASKQLDNIDNECFLLPHVVPFLQYPIIQLQDQCVFLSALREPIPRGVLDYILKQQNIIEIFDCLLDRAVVRNSNLQNPDKNLSYPAIDGHLIPIFKKQQSLGLNEDHEDSLLALKEHILKQHFSKQQFSEVESHYSNARGVINVKSLPGLVVPRSKELAYRSAVLPVSTSYSKKKANQKTGSVGSDKSHVNEDWDRLFGEPAKPSQSKEFSGSSSKAKKPPSSPETRKKVDGGVDTQPPKSPSRSQGEQQFLGFTENKNLPRTETGRSDDTNSSFDVSRSSDNILSLTPHQEGGKAKSRTSGLRSSHKRSHSEGAIAKMSIKSRNESNVSEPPPKSGSGSPGLIERSMVKVEYASCRENLKELLEYKQKQYEEDMRFMDMDLTRNAAFQTSPGWIPKGQLIAHIHDHKGAVNKLRVLPDSSIFASFSNDGCTKLWDVSRIEAKTVANRPRMTYSHQGGQIRTGSFCQVNRSIAAASTNGTLHVFNIEAKKVGSSNKRQLLLETKVDPTENGTVVDMATFSMGGDEVICYATSMGKLCGLDLRSNKPAWELTNSSKFGLNLSMAVDPLENWTALGTSLGYHVIWDMRFQLPIRYWQHAGHGKFNIHHVYDLSPHPTQPSSLISAVSYNNEISIWDMETASRRQMLWASPAPAFGEMTGNPRQQDTVRALSTCIIDNCPVVLGGGTDRTIRLWNLVDPTQCCCIVRPKLHSRRINFDYVSKITEGVDVFMEVFSVGAPSSGSGQVGVSEVGQAESAHSSVHVDFITALAVVPYKQQQFIVSASQDGVLKYWK